MSPFLTRPPLDFQPFSPIRSAAHDARLDPRQSRAGERRLRHHQDAGWRGIAVCALGAAGGSQGHGLRLHRPQRADRKVFRDGARFARSRLRGGDDRLARAGPFVAAPARSAQRLCPSISPTIEVDVETFVQQVVLPDCPPPYFALAHSMGGAVMLRVAHAGKRWFDRMVLSAPMIDLPGHRTSLPARALLRVLRLAGLGGRYIPGGSDALTGAESVRQQSPDQRSRALRPQRRDPRGGSDARHRVADGGLGRYRVPRDARLSRLELSARRSVSRS